MSEELVVFDPEEDSSNTVDLLLTVIPGESAAGAATIEVKAECDGVIVGRLTATVLAGS